MREARTCYSHLAGKLGVALADALVAQGWLADGHGDYRLTPEGTQALRTLGIELESRSGQTLARKCVDWTERRHHVAGPLGIALAELTLRRGWVRRLRGTRALMITPTGRAQLARVFKVRI